jgi:hypothetical protein
LELLEKSLRKLICIDVPRVIALLLNWERLVLVRRLAIRKRVWFKFLDRCERAILSLTIKCVERIRSVKLAKIVKAIVDKLTDAMKGNVERLMETVGSTLAVRLSMIAVGWGNHSANRWAHDRGFMRFLAVNYMNTPRIIRDK